MKFYTDVSLYRNEILLRGYDNGRRVKECVAFRPYLFLPSKEQTEYRTLDGRYVDKITFDSIREARDFTKKYDDVSNFEFFGITNYDYLYIYENYKGRIEYDFDKLSVVVLDIETDCSSGFPDMDTADKEVWSITLRKNGNSLVLGQKHWKPKDENTRYVLCKDEADLLRNFLYFWNSDEWQPDIITGWYIDFFDIPYLVRRITRVLSENEARRLSPWEKLSSRKIYVKGQEKEVFVPVGIQTLDYQEVYKKFSFKNHESYSLEYICQEVLGVGKLDYSEWGSLADLYNGIIQVGEDADVKKGSVAELAKLRSKLRNELDRRKRK